MTDANTRLIQREERERGLAAAAINPDIAAVRRELADRYQRLAISTMPRQPR